MDVPFEEVVPYEERRIETAWWNWKFPGIVSLIRRQVSSVYSVRVQVRSQSGDFEADTEVNLLR